MGLGTILTVPNLASAATTDTTVASPPTTSAAKASTKATDGTAKTKGSGVESGQNAAAAKVLGITEAELKDRGAGW